MVLEQKFRDEYLDILNDVTNTIWFDYFIEKSIWKYENELDFVYGHKVGIIITALMSAYLKVYDAQPNLENLKEMYFMIESRIDEIKSDAKKILDVK